jgi:hypothetical protein
LRRENGTVRDFTISYDSGGRRTSIEIPLPGKGKNPPSLITNYSYDNASRLLNMKHLKSNTVLEDLIYEYDPNEIGKIGRKNKK